MKPDGYPLPWCDALDAAYHQVNTGLIFARRTWLEWQSSRTMAQIIPVIDWLADTGGLPPLRTHNGS